MALSMLSSRRLPRNASDDDSHDEAEIQQIVNGDYHDASTPVLFQAARSR